MAYDRDPSNDLVWDETLGEYVAAPQAEQYTLTIVPDPADATVVLTATGYTQSGNSITVDPNTSVSYTVSKTGYITSSDTVTVTADISIAVTLGTTITVTLDPAPSDATVVLVSAGFSQVGNTIQANTGTEVTYTVSKTGYVTKTGSIVAGNTDMTYPVRIWPVDHALHLQVLRGTNAENLDYIGNPGEITADTELNQIRLHDGTTVGGHVIGENKDSDHGVSLFDTKWVDHLLNDECWLRTETFSWHDGDMYRLAYNHLVDDITGVTPTTETIQNIAISYYQAEDGHKIIMPNQEQYAVAIFEATGVAWYYILDTTNHQFKLPRASNPGTAWYMPLSVAISEYGANQQYLYMYVGNYQTVPNDNSIAILNDVNERLNEIHNTGIVTVNQGGSQIAQFSLNQDSDVTVDIQGLPNLPESTEDDYTRVVRVGKNGIYELGAEQYTPNLFDYKRSDYKLNDASWLCADTFSWQNGNMYHVAYDHLCEDIKTSVVTSITGTLSTVLLSGPWYRKSMLDVGEFYLWENGDGATVATNSANPTYDDIIISGNYASESNTWAQAVAASTTADIIGTVGGMNTITGAIKKKAYLKSNVSQCYANVHVDNDGCISGFGGTISYARVDGVYTPTTSLEVVMKIHTPVSSVGYGSGASFFHCHGANYNGLILRLMTTTNLKMWITSNGSSWNVASGKDHTCDIPYDVDRWFKLTWDGAIYTLYISTDGINYTSIGTISSTAAVYWNGQKAFDLGGCSWESYSFTGGIIDLKESYVKIDGNLVWQGAESIDYYEAQDGHKLVYADQEDKVNQLYTKGEEAWYYIIEPKVSEIGVSTLAALQHLARKPDYDESGNRNPYAWCFNDGYDDYVFFTTTEYPNVGDEAYVTPTATAGTSITRIDYNTENRGRFKLPRKKSRILVSTGIEKGVWYRLYSDGWVEQGGLDLYYATGGWSGQDYFGLVVPMRDTNYSLYWTNGWTGYVDHDTVVMAKYTNGFRMSQKVNYDSQRQANWEVKGYSAIDMSKYNAAEKRLYFYMGNFRKTALENSAGINMEILNNKVDIDQLQNYVILSEFQAPTAANNYTWYKRYTNGWIEQGGVVVSGSGTSGTIVLPVQMLNTDYVWQASVSNNAANNFFILDWQNSRTTTAIGWYKSADGIPGSWQVSGMAASN